MRSHVAAVHVVFSRADLVPLLYSARQKICLGAKGFDEAACEVVHET